MSHSPLIIWGAVQGREGHGSFPRYRPMPFETTATRPPWLLGTCGVEVQMETCRQWKMHRGCQRLSIKKVKYLVSTLKTLFIFSID